MSKIAVVSQLWDEEKKDWEEPELLHVFQNEDETFAREEAADEAAMRLNDLVKDAERPSNERELTFPWLERIVVCPVLAGLGKGGSDQYAVDDRTFTLTVGLHP